MRKVLCYKSCLLSFLVLVTHPAYAVEIEPMRLEYSLQAGKTYSGIFKLKNSSNFAVDILVSTGEYRYIFSKGTLPPENEKKEMPSCQSWFTFEKTTFNLNPGASTDAKFLIKVPTDADQEHLCAILFDEKTKVKSRQETGSAQIQLTPRFSIPVYVSIKDSEKISAKINDIAVGPEPARDGPILDITIENTGSVHIRPFGTLIILNQNGDIIKNLSIGKSLPIFPGYREIIPVVCSKLSSGKYSAVATIEISKDNIIQKKAAFEFRPRHD